MPINPSNPTGRKDTSSYHSSSASLRKHEKTKSKSDDKKPEGNENKPQFLDDPEVLEGSENEVQEAIHKAESIGSKMAQITLKDGTKYFCPVQTLKDWLAMEDSSAMAEYGDVPDPYEGMNESRSFSDPFLQQSGDRNTKGGATLHRFLTQGQGTGKGTNTAYNNQLQFNLAQNQQTLQSLMNQKGEQDVYAMKSKAKKAQQELQTFMAKVRMLILSGDTVGALRLTVFRLMNNNQKDNLVRIRITNNMQDKKARLMEALGRITPPRTSPNASAAQLGYEQWKQQRYNQRVTQITNAAGMMDKSSQEIFENMAAAGRWETQLWELLSQVTENVQKQFRSITSIRG